VDSKDPIARGFEGELRKIALDVGAMAGPAKRILSSPGVQAAAVPAVAGVGLGVLSLYDLLKARGLTREPITSEELQGIGPGRKQVDAEKYIKEMEKAHPTERPLVPVTSSRDVSKMVRDPSAKNPLLKVVLKTKAKKVHKDKSNAFMFPGKEKDYIVVPEKVNPRVVEHEVGHAWDIEGKPEKGLLHRLHLALGKLWKPAYQKTKMEPEERAWEAAKKTPSRERALKSYEAAFHKSRGRLAGRIAIPVALRALLAGLGAGMGASP
jgi:hypothetical protein